MNLVRVFKGVVSSQRALAAVFASALLLGTGTAGADDHAGEPDIAAGEALSAACAACHGADGNTPLLPEYPRLGGQNAKYLFSQLEMIKDKTREIALMAGQLDNMDEADLKNIAAYYASLPAAGGQADASDETLQAASMLYRGGDLEREIAACTSCHSPHGAGNALAGFPRIAGQSVDYTIAQLTAYREGERQSDEAFGGMMRGVAARLKDHEIEALAELLSGLN